MPLGVRVWLHLASLVALMVASGFFAWGAFSLTRDSWDFGSTDLSALHTPLAVPQGLWAAGLGLLLLAVVALAARAVRQLATGDADGMDRMLMARTYVDEATETLEAVAEAQQGMQSPVSQPATAGAAR
jgi:TRAP-type C4-dicarboxylate transport system permease small subunit